jgi:hypothetical protein
MTGQVHAVTSSEVHVPKLPVKPMLRGVPRGISQCTQVTEFSDDGVAVSESESSEDEHADEDEVEKTSEVTRSSSTRMMAACTLGVVDERSDSSSTKESEKPVSPVPGRLDSTNQGSRSIRSDPPKPCLKPYSPQEIPVLTKNKRCAWKTLPKPNLEEIHQRVRTAAPRVEARPRHVTFHQIIVRAYDQCIGDNPCVSYGPPISLDWEYQEMEAISLDEYETSRPPRRKPRQLMLNYYARRNILSFCFGATEDELKIASKLADKSKRERSMTRAFLPALALENIVESANRKTMRFRSRRKAAADV